jgi:orotate phosphoribosyltransferase
MTRAELGTALFDRSYVRGSFRLRSGVISGEYFDKYQFEAEPRLLLAVSEAMARLVPPGIDALAGLELGGVPVATVLAQVTDLPVVFVRKQAKSYGTARLAEGGPIAGRRLLLIEDVVTSGGQVVDSANALRALDAVVEHALCVIDREAGGAKALAAIGVSLHPLFGYRELQSLAADRYPPPG